MIESLKKSLEAHPENPFLQGHVEALAAAEESRNARRSAADCSVVRWLSVADEMPDDGLTVMIHHAEEDEPVWLGYYDGGDGTWRTVDGARTAVTHWADMPDPPNVTTLPTEGAVACSPSS